MAALVKFSLCFEPAERCVFEFYSIFNVWNVNKGGDNYTESYEYLLIFKSAVKTIWSKIALAFDSESQLIGKALRC